MLYDTHMHCLYSGDSDTPAEEMVKKAIELNLKGICFTDHLDFNYREEVGMFLLDFPAYKDEITRLSSIYKEKLDILWGIEVGLSPKVIEDNRMVTNHYPFDFVIGSIHCVKEIDVYYDTFFKDRSEDEAYTEYFLTALEAAQSDADFDVFGHIDYIVRYGPNKNKEYSYRKYADLIDQILRALIDKGRGIEINTAGFKYGLGHPNPTEDIIRRYRELGGQIITIGADGHKPEHIAFDFDKIPGLLKDAGFDYYTVFRERKANFIKLD